MNKNVLICGIGGQGTVLASKLIAASAMRMGEIVHSAETIGMAQRGGSVTSHVRIGEAYSPLIPKGQTDILVAFEPSEAVRNLSYVKDNGVVVVNDTPIKPTTESLQETGYDGKEMLEYLQGKRQCVVVQGGKLCEKLGSSKFLNVAMLGVVAGTGRLEIDTAVLETQITESVPERFLETNLQAFREGIKIGEEYAAK